MLLIITFVLCLILWIFLTMAVIGYFITYGEKGGLTKWDRLVFIRFLLPLYTIVSVCSYLMMARLQWG